jgi:hypothetical protein
MTSITPRPMNTPDLAGILGKPRRRATPPPPVVTEEPVRVSAGDEAPEADQTVRPADQVDVAAPSGRSVASLSRARDSKSSRQGGGERTRAAEADVVVQEDEDTRRYLRTMTVYLPRSTYRRLQVEAERRQMSRTALLLIAVNEMHDRLPELLAEAPLPRGALFDVPQARAPKVEPNTQTSIRVTDQQLSILEALGKQHGTTRSRVLAAAFDAYVN